MILKAIKILPLLAPLTLQSNEVITNQNHYFTNVSYADTYRTETIYNSSGQQIGTKQAYTQTGRDSWQADYVEVTVRSYSEVYWGYNGRVAFYEVQADQYSPSYLLCVKFSNITGVIQSYLESTLNTLYANNIYAGYTYNMAWSMDLFITNNNMDYILNHDPTETSIYTCWTDLMTNYTVRHLMHRDGQITLSSQDNIFVTGANIEEWDMNSNVDTYVFAYFNAFSLNNQTQFYTDETVIEDSGPFWQDYYSTANNRWEFCYVGYDLLALAPTQVVVDIPGLMFEVLSMPFTFIGQAFNLTIFPGTQYQFNLTNFFLAIIATLTFAMIVKIIMRFIK